MKLTLTASMLGWLLLFAACAVLLFVASQALVSVAGHLLSDSRSAGWGEGR